MIILCVLFRKYSFVPKRPLVCLSVCLSPTGRIFKLIFMKLHHMVEFVRRKKPIVFEVKRSQGQHSPKVNNFGVIYKILNFHPIDLKFEEDLYLRSLNSTSQFFLSSTWTKRSTQAKVNNEGEISKIVNFHPTDLKFEEDYRIWSLNSTTNYF